MGDMRFLGRAASEGTGKEAASFPSSGNDYAINIPE
jgi:hypothetical protein